MENIKKCIDCDERPYIDYDELGFTYNLYCPKCKKTTRTLMSTSATLQNPQCDDATWNALVEEWNNMNKIKPFRVNI